MRKQIFGRQLQRDTHERKALFKSLMEALVLRESIKTTEAKAKAVKGQVEKFVTKARVGGVKAERSLQPYFAPVVMKKLINEIAPRFQNRPGGYTRIIRLGNRFSDNAQMVILEWVEKPASKSASSKGTSLKETTGKKAAKTSTGETMEATAPVESLKGAAKKATKKAPAKKTK